MHIVLSQKNTISSDGLRHNICIRVQRRYYHTVVAGYHKSIIHNTIIIDLLILLVDLSERWHTKISNNKNILCKFVTRDYDGEHEQLRCT